MSVDLRIFADPETLSRTAATRRPHLFLRGADGGRPVYGNVEKCQFDPHWRDLIRCDNVVGRKEAPWHNDSILYV